MKRISITLLFLFVLTLGGLSAQLLDDIRNILKSDSTQTTTPARDNTEASHDSVEIVQLKRQLDSIRLNEANLKMEFEALQLQHYKGDSLKVMRQRLRIDSLRSVTKGAPVIIEKDTLFSIFGKQDGMSATQRADLESEAIKRLTRRKRFSPDSLTIASSDDATNLIYDKKVIITVTEQDALWAGKPREELITLYRDHIIKVVDQVKRERHWWQTGKRVMYFVLILAVLVVLFKLLNWLLRKVKVKIENFGQKRLKPLSVQNFEVLDVEKQVKVLTFFASMVRYAVMLVLLILTVPLLFSIFPQTKKLATKILTYILDPVKSIFEAVVHYIPNLFTIAIIYIAVRYLIKLVRYIANELQSERLKIGGFYSDWAIPSYHIVRFLLYAFMIAMIYPYLPGAKSGVFQGISVFIGLIFSLGSSTVIGNIIAGLVITYMRSFKLGDRIKLNDTTGDVIEKTPLVIRIRTPKNEVVTLPNSFMMSTQTVNFSHSAREFGLIIHSEVTIGYDAPWRKVHQLLINAALKTPGVQTDPEPFVLETSLNDFYPVYQVNAYIRDASKIAQIYSDLHQNIQDEFNAADVEIMSPHYRGMRNGNETTIPKNDLKTDYPQFDEKMEKRRKDDLRDDEEIMRTNKEYFDPSNDVNPMDKTDLKQNSVQPEAAQNSGTTQNAATAG